MGVIKRQSIYSSIFIYVGIIIGYFNQAFLFPLWLEPDQLGYIRWALSVGSMVGILAQLGIPAITLKYFPYFKNKEQQHQGYLTFSLSVALTGILLAGTLLILGKDTIIERFAEPEHKYFLDHYYYVLFAVGGFTVIFNVLTSYCTSLLKSSVPIFFRDIFIRAYGLTLIFLHHFEYLDFTWLLAAFIGGFGIQSIGLLIYLKRIGELHLLLRHSVFKSEHFKEMLRYGAYSFMSGGVLLFIQYMDILMVTDLTEDKFANAGIYGTFFMVGTVIGVPMRAITTIVFPIVANAWKENNLKLIHDLYKKTSIVQLTISGLLFLGVWANLHNYIGLLNNEAFTRWKWIPIIIGCGKLFNSMTGNNGGIIVTSKYYRFNLLFNVLLIGFTFLTNLWLIPIYGLYGAAIATALTAFVYNIMKSLFVYFVFKMQPFTWGTLKVFFIFGLILLLNQFLPTLDNLWLDILYRSAIITIIYGSLILLLHVSEDINRFWDNMLNRAKSYIGRGK